MPPITSPSILFLAQVPSQAASQFAIMEDEERKSYRDGIVIPPASSLTYPSTFSDSEIQEGSIAYHPVFGFITYNSWWNFSTKQFIENIKAADENPAISAHLLHIDTQGGESFGLHEAWLAIRALKKPCYALVESAAESAGYYIASAANKIFASSIFSEIGCIGVMGILYDTEKSLEMEGIKRHKLYSNFSPRKNKVVTDAIEGEPDEYIKKFLDPLAEQFIADVKAARPSVTQEALEGETYFTTEAMAAGLIDGEGSIDEVLEQLKAAGNPAPKKSPSVDINKLKF